MPSRAFRDWSAAAISEPLRLELEQAAAQSELSIERFVAELIESDMAARRLPRCITAGEARVQGSEDVDEFPFPPTYSVNLQR